MNPHVKSDKHYKVDDNAHETHHVHRSLIKLGHLTFEAGQGRVKIDICDRLYRLAGDVENALLNCQNSCGQSSSHTCDEA